MCSPIVAEPSISAFNCSTSFNVFNFAKSFKTDAFCLGSWNFFSIIGFSASFASSSSFLSFASLFALYSAVNSCFWTSPVSGTFSLHLSNTFVLSLYVALFGISFVTFSLSHSVPVNTSMYLYLFVPSIVLPSPASKVTLV